MFWRRKKPAPAPELRLVQTIEFTALPAGHDRVETFYKDGRTYVAEAFKIDWNHPGLTGFRVLEKGWRTC